MEEKKRTGYPSNDKPWLQYYSEEAIHAKLPECTMYSYLYQQNRDSLGDIALTYFGRRITYGQLLDRIDIAASAFFRIGVRCGDIVTLCTVTTPETVFTVYGLNKLGAVVSAIDPRTNEEGIKRYINEVRSTVLVMLDAAYPKIRRIVADTAIQNVIVVSASDSMPYMTRLGYRLTEQRALSPLPAGERYIRWKAFIADGCNTESEVPRYSKDAPAVIVHTGGTTGTPKGVVLSNDNLNALAFQFFTSPRGFARRQRFLDIMPPFIAYGLGSGLHMPLCLGMETVLVPKLNPRQLDRLILKYKPNVTASVPTHWETLLSSRKLRRADLCFYTHPGVGGDGMNVELEARVNAFLHARRAPDDISKGYGLTEVCSAASLSMKNCNALGSVGIPFLGNTISAFAPGTHNELPYGEQGELCITGPTVMCGYYQNGDETDRAVQRHADGRRWVHTGDVGYITESGLIYVVDRIKRVIIRTDGFKVYPSIIENVLTKHPAVESCAVIGLPCPGFSQGMVPKAFVVLQKEAANQQDAALPEIMALCRRDLPEYAQPASYTVLDALPLTPIGKIDYRALERMANP